MVHNLTLTFLQKKRRKFGKIYNQSKPTKRNFHDCTAQLPGSKEIKFDQHSNMSV